MKALDRSRPIERVARQSQRVIASPAAPVVTLAAILLALRFLPSLGVPLERVSDLHFLVGVVTLLLVYLVEHNARRDVAAMQVKLDEIMKALRVEHGRIGVEELPADEIEKVRDRQRESAERP